MRDDEGPNIKVRIDDDEAGKYRAGVDRTGEQIVICIKGGHPAVRRYRSNASGLVEGESTLFQALVAEIVADHAVRMVMERQFPVSGTEPLDAARFYAEHYTHLAKYLTRCQAWSHRAVICRMTGL